MISSFSHQRVDGRNVLDELTSLHPGLLTASPALVPLVFDLNTSQLPRLVAPPRAADEC